MNRTGNALRNMGFALAGQLLTLLAAFFTRGVFVRTLSAEYLGMNGLFSSILSLLSLAELGVGAAITFGLYRPLADQDTLEVKALMSFFRRAYVRIGLSIFFLSLLLLPFLPNLLKSPQALEDLRLYFFLFALNNAISYFFSYKRALLIADQKEYLSVFYQSFFFLLRNGYQVLALILTRSFWLYLIIQFVMTLLENILISIKADSLYPFLKETQALRLTPEAFATLKRNTLAMLAHKIGAVVVFGTDNILISKLVGIVEVGLYSNYSMVVVAMNTLLQRFLGALTASVGNLVATEPEERILVVFDSLNLLSYWLTALSSIGLFFLLNPFVKLWLGEQYLFPLPLVTIIVANFYLGRMRNPVLVFRDALGLFWKDRYKPLLEATVNLFASLVFYRYLGFIGILVGTTFSTLTTCFWIEPYVLFRYGLRRPLKKYFKRFLFHTALMFIAGLITAIAIALFKDDGFASLLTRIFTVLLIPNLVFWGVFRKTEEFRYLSGKIPWFPRR